MPHLFVALVIFFAVMIVSTLFCYFCFLYFYLYKNNPEVLKCCGVPAFFYQSQSAKMAWCVLLVSALPWWYLMGFEVGVAAWLVALSLVALPVVLIYPVAPQKLLRISKGLLILGLILIVLGEFGAAYVK